MSYIRASTPVRKRKGDGAFEKISNAYAYGDGRYVVISTGWKRTLDLLVKTHGKKKGKKLFDQLTNNEKVPQVHLTDAEMRTMCRNYLRKRKVRL